MLWKACAPATKRWRDGGNLLAGRGVETPALTVLAPEALVPADRASVHLLDDLIVISAFVAAGGQQGEGESGGGERGGE
jgi:hypothetical protein